MIQRVAGLFRGTGIGRIPLVKKVYLTLNSFTTRNNYLKRLNLKDFSIYVDLRDTGDLTSTLLVKGEYDLVMSGALKRVVKPDSICIDIGANIGYFTLMMASCKVRRIWAYEPEKRNFNLLARNTKDLPNVYPVRGAISDIDGKGYLDTNKNYYGAHYLASSGDLIDIARLDSLHNSRVDFIKVDAQGSEVKILEGMRGILQRNPYLSMVWAYLPHGLRRANSDPFYLLNQLALLGPMADLDEKAKKEIPNVTPEFLYKKYPDGKSTNILIRR